MRSRDAKANHRLCDRLFGRMGDKTQLATLLYAADRNASKIAIFLAAAGALVLSTGIAVVAGAKLASILSPTALKAAAG